MCNDGEAALGKLFEKHDDCLNHRPYKLVILDNEMPMRSGIQVAI